MRDHTLLFNAISGILFGTALALSGVVFAQDNESQFENELVIEEVVVTGSRIIRTDHFDAGSQVVTIDRADIDAMAELNIADVLRASPLNTYGSFSEQSGSSYQSNATFNLRGLGSSRTLVLLDGTRIPGSPNLGADSVNINMLPMAAVERVDILADGSSAVYGSDAVAGVVNLSLYKKFEGIELFARYGDRDRDDGGDRALSVLAGASNDRGSIVFAMEYSMRDIIYDTDREITAPWIRDDGDGRLDIYNDTDGISYYGQTWEIWDPNTYYYDISASATCPDDPANGWTGVMGTLAFGDPTGTVCSFAYAAVSANRAELEKTNSYMYGNYEFSDMHEIYVRGFFSKNGSFGRYAPPAANWINPPADHEHNPFDLEQMLADGLITEDAELFAYYRWSNIGNRDTVVSDMQWDLLGGFRGNFTDNVSYDFYLQKGEYTSSDVGRYFLSFTGLDHVLVNEIDPFSPEGVAAMRATTTQDNFTRQAKIHGHVQMGTGDLWGAGESILLLGSEYMDIKYQNQYDAASEAGLVGGSAGQSSAGTRDFIAVFAEFLLPITRNSELTIAGRYDNYSDFGSAFSPSLSYAIKVTDRLGLRARWGQGFKAPALNLLYGPDSFQATGGYDPVTGTSRQYSTYSHSNPNLDAEESQSISLGLNWEYLQNHVLDLAWYRIEIEGGIDYPDVSSLLYADAVGQSWPSDGNEVIRQGGFVREIQIYAANFDRLEASGIDLQLNSFFDTGIGLFNLGLFASYQLEYKLPAYYNGPVQNTTGFRYKPRSRAQFTGSWNLGDWGIDLVVDYIGKTADEDLLDIETGIVTASNHDIDSWTTGNLSLRYDAGRFGRFRVGANNFSDEDPVLNKDGKFDDFFLYNALGRVYFIEYRIKFD